MARIIASARLALRKPALHPIQWPLQLRQFSSRTGLKFFTKTHEYVYVTGTNSAYVGITNFAQKELGDVVYVELTEPGTKLKEAEPFGTVESTKASSSVYAPVDMEILRHNQAVLDDNRLVNDKPESDGWLVDVKLTDMTQLDGLLDKEAYEKHVKDSSH